jgi:hypothetical protein
MGTMELLVSEATFGPVRVGSDDGSRDNTWCDAYVKFGEARRCGIAGAKVCAGIDGGTPMLFWPKTEGIGRVSMAPTMFPEIDTRDSAGLGGCRTSLI